MAENNNDNDEAAQIEKEAAERRLFRKLTARARLLRLAESDGPQRTAAQREIEALRSYIDQWSAWMHRDSGGGELPHSAPYAEEGRTWEHQILDPLDTPNLWAIKIVDAAMNELAATPEGMRMRAAMKVRWLNETIYTSTDQPAAVFRHSRVAPHEVDDLADAGERALIPMVKRRGLPLE